MPDEPVKQQPDIDALLESLNRMHAQGSNPYADRVNAYRAFKVICSLQDRVKELEDNRKRLMERDGDRCQQALTIAERDATIVGLRTWIKENAYHAGEWCPAWDGAPAECECGFEEAALGEGE
ncbi:hypothetical protein LCGC14_1818230 [marine sediment metagenome]|uniref:Uncharacterized protein n=1 Tax=marine sediment metagenome TaxID=412755 RepID=A0A0F9GJR2_9ZZZZ